MHISSSRRTFLRGLAGVSLAAAAGCKCNCCKGSQKIKLAVVGVMGKGFSDWTPMLNSGMVEIVAFCDCDYTQRDKAQLKLIQEGIDFDMYRVPFYTDYRRLLDDCGILGVDAMTISTPDHVHAPVAIRAMQMGIHVYVQKPLVRTLWELDYFNKTAKENNVIVQMGNQGSSLDSMRRCVEVLQSGVLGDVTEVHVWTDRPVWPQGKLLGDYIKSRGDNGDPIPAGLNWDAFLATAKKRAYLGAFPENLGPFHNDWKIGPNVYHMFNWRSSPDFGAGAFGDMACHTMNLPFRGLELADVTEAECEMSEGGCDNNYPVKSRVRLTYRERVAKFGKNAGKLLPAVTLYWYDGDVKPSAQLMPKYASAHEGKVPDTGCFIIGTKGSVLMQDDYGGVCAIALNDDKEYVDVFKHPACTKEQIPSRIPHCEGPVSVAGEKSVEMKGFGEGHYLEFCRAIRGEGPVYEDTNSRCFSDIEYCIPQMEGIIVGVTAQRVSGKLKWDTKAQKFDVAAANDLIKPYIREGWEF